MKFDDSQIGGHIANVYSFHQYFVTGVKRVVEFAKLVPGFCDFSQDDQLILIKLGFFEIWLSHATKLVTDGSLTFDDGSYLSKEQLELIYDVS